jgi:hypothetical protein
MGTKNNPGAYDCEAKAHPDEPKFTLLGRDPIAHHLVAIWSALASGKPGFARVFLEDAIREVATPTQPEAKWRGLWMLARRPPRQPRRARTAGAAMGALPLLRSSRARSPGHGHTQCRRCHGVIERCCDD